MEELKTRLEFAHHQNTAGMWVPTIILKQNNPSLA